MGATSIGRIPKACGMGPNFGNVAPPADTGCFPDSRNSTLPPCSGPTEVGGASSRLMGEREGAGDRLPMLGPMGPVPRVIEGDGEGVGGATGGLANVALGATGWKGH